MSYNCIVAEVNSIREIQNADNIQLIDILGYNIVTGKDIKIRDKLLLFLSDGQLSEEYAKINNLVRTKNEDGSVSGGFFETNRRVRAIKLRGVKSEGYVASLESVAYTGIDINTLEVGMQFTDLGDHHICHKYISERTRKAAAQNQRKTRRGETEMFHKQPDIGPFRTEKGEIPEGAIIYLTTKVHGTCIIGTSRILMSDGSYKLIKDISIGDNVLGLNENNELVGSKVLTTFNNGGNTNGWYKIGVKRKGTAGRGNHTYFLTCTPEHLVWTENGYIEAQKLSIGNNLLLGSVWQGITQLQKQVLLVWKEIESIEYIKKLKSGNTKYDIETETHNFFANHILVHNSHRISNVLDDVAPTFIDKILSFFNKSRAPRKEWTVLNGSKNVILEYSDSRNSFYGNDTFRYNALSGVLPRKGETIYMELVGWAGPEEDQMIMGSVDTSKFPEFKKKYGPKMVYSYGCDVGQTDIYVYRITMTNEDGQSVELSFPQVMQRSRELGLKHVPLIEKFVYDGNMRDLEEKIDKMTNGDDGLQSFPSVIDPRHIEEGMVVRYESEYGIGFCKSKNFNFLVLEGVWRDNPNNVDLEEIS